MRERQNDDGKGNGTMLTCPHCRAATDGSTLGLFWDFDSHCWGCIICGYRYYEGATRRRTKAQEVAGSRKD